MKDWEEAFADLSGRLNSYEYREGQKEFAAAVDRTLIEGGSLLAEAGTGTGKSFAYLLPLLVHAARQKERVVISTGTITLQEQIFLKDLPFLRQILPEMPEAVLIKGRGHYLCRWRLERQREMAGLFTEEAWPELVAWAGCTRTGDEAEFEGHLPAGLWARVAADDSCLRPYCPYQSECFFLSSRERSFQARVLVLNHHMYLSDLKVRLASGGEAALLPDHPVAVFDEAHHLPETAAGAFTVEASLYRFLSLSRYLRLLSLSDLEPGFAQELENAAAAFFGAIGPPNGDHEGAWRLESYPVELATGIRSRLGQLVRSLAGLNLQQLEPSQREAAARVVQEAERLRSDLHFILTGEEGYLSWAELLPEDRRGRALIKATPLEVGDLLREHLFADLRASVLTSATLSVAGDFRFFRREVGVPAGAELCVSSPFSFGEQCLLYAPTDMPDPNGPDFYAAAAQRIAHLLACSRGRALVLFTSYRGLNLAYDCLADRFPFPVYRQGEAPRHVLLEDFRRETDSVLLATASFWEGIDVPGEALSCLIIDRLPFSMPSHPVTRARVETVKKNGGNGFTQYTLPQAVLRLKQGFGRLIRSRADRGVAAILDPRLSLRPYGRRFLAALPPCPVTGSLEEVRRFFQA